MTRLVRFKSLEISAQTLKREYPQNWSELYHETLERAIALSRDTGAKDSPFIRESDRACGVRLEQVFERLQRAAAPENRRVRNPLPSLLEKEGRVLR